MVQALQIVKQPNKLNLGPNPNSPLTKFSTENPSSFGPNAASPSSLQYHPRTPPRISRHEPPQHAPLHALAIPGRRSCRAGVFSGEIGAWGTRLERWRKEGGG